MSTPHDPHTVGGAVPPVPPAPAGGRAATPSPAPAPAGYPQGYPQQAAGYPQGQPAGTYPPVPPTGYGQPGAGMPKAPDQRPKTLALVALILAIVGFISTCIGFSPIGLIFVIVGGLLLLAAFVLSIVALASRKQGGKGLGIAGLIVSVVGGIVFVFALAVSIFWAAYSATTSSLSTSSAPAASAPADSGADEGTAQVATGDYDEAAYLAEVRPQVRALFQDIQSGITDEQVDAAYGDAILLTAGKGILAAEQLGGDDALAQQADTIVDTSGGSIDQEHAEQFVDILLSAAHAHLVE